MSKLATVSGGTVTAALRAPLFPCVAAVLLLALCASPGPASAQTLARDLQRLANPGPPLRPLAEEVFTEHRIGGLSLREYLQPLDFQACLTAVQGDLVKGLDRLRALHIMSQESRGVPATWRVWNKQLEGLSPDAIVLVSTWLDSPETARRLFFCEDGLPTSWRGLDPDSYVIEAVTWFDIEVADREHSLHRGSPGDREQAVMSLMELRSTLLDRFDTTYAGTGASLKAREGLEERLRLMWDGLVEPFHYGFTPRARTTTPVADPSSTPAYQPTSPFSAGGAGIPDPRDVALRDRVVRSWRRQRKTVDREVEDRQIRLDEAIAGLEAASSPAELDRGVRVALRLDAELAQSVADLERLQSRVRLLNTGRPWVDDMLSNGFRRRAVRRLDRRESMVMRQRDQVEAVIASAVERGATPPEILFDGGGPPEGSREGVAQSGEPGPGNWLAGLPSGSSPAIGETDTNELAEGSGWVERIYEGPLPPPSKVWTEELVGAIRSRHPSLDADDVRILLGLVRATYSELPGRAAIEEAVWRTLSTPSGLSIGGEESTLSELYIPGESRAEQPIITFVLTLKF